MRRRLRCSFALQSCCTHTGGRKGTSLTGEFRLGRMVVWGGLLGVLGLAAGFLLTRLIGLSLHLFWFGKIGFELVEPHQSPYAGQ